MRTQQVPNSPYFIHYDDNGYCCISKSKESQESIPESEMQEFLDAVANGLLYIEKERKSRYQRIDEAEKTAFARGEAEGKEDKLIATVRELEEKQALLFRSYFNLPKKRITSAPCASVRLEVYYLRNQKESSFARTPLMAQFSFSFCSEQKTKMLPPR